MSFLGVPETVLFLGLGLPEQMTLFHVTFFGHQNVTNYTLIVLRQCLLKLNIFHLYCEILQHLHDIDIIIPLTHVCFVLIPNKNKIRHIKLYLKNAK